MKVVLTLLSPPPSLNNSTYNVPGKGRRKTRAYKDWRRDAAWQLKLQKPPHFTERVSVTIILPMNTRGDADNRIKAVLDSLQEAGVVKNDKQCFPTLVDRGDVELTTITIEPRVEP